MKRLLLLVVALIFLGGCRVYVPSLGVFECEPNGLGWSCAKIADYKRL